VRPARRADLPALLALEQRAFQGDRLSARQFRHHLGNPSAWFAVAEIEGQLAGNALLFFRRGSAVARLYSIVVASKARGRGLGARLLVAAEAAARRHGCREVRLEVRQDNTAAIALYEGAGYQRVAKLPDYYADGAAGWRYARPIARRAPRRRPWT
jgi:ribosomal-protein-alanine acetyltransferase